MARYYHGSTHKFTHFDLSRTGESTGVKFGFGIYLTERFETAAHYAYPRNTQGISGPFYVYTLDVPEVTVDNSLNLNPNVRLSEDLIRKVEETFGEPLPTEAVAEPKFLRKYAGNLLVWRARNSQSEIVKRPNIKQLIGKADVNAERKAALLFHSIGILYYQWPVVWKHPEGEQNLAVLSAEDITIVKVEQVELDDKKHQLIEKSRRIVTL